jgi:hypothetical protein
VTALSFKVIGLDDLDKFGDSFDKEIKRQVDLASKAGVNKASDLIAYGRTSRINADTVASDSAVGRAAKTLKIPVEHVFYRTFSLGIKVGVGKGRLAKPFASVMMRGNSILLSRLLVSGKAAKSMYGFESRKRKTGSKSKPDMQGLVNSARIGGRRGNKVRIAGRTFDNSFLEDGTKRNSSEAMNRHYINRLGADRNRKLAGRQFLLIQRKNKGQKLPYPSKVVKIKSSRVTQVFSLALGVSLNSKHRKISELQTKEVHRKLKKLGFDLK